jgi:hypothetical protein
MRHRARWFGSHHRCEKADRIEDLRSATWNFRVGKNEDNVALLLSKKK